MVVLFWTPSISESRKNILWLSTDLFPNRFKEGTNKPKINNRVEPDQPVEATLDAYPDWKTPFKVIAIIPTADRQKSTVKVRVGFDKLDPRILPEMAVKVAFRDTGATGASRSVIIPKSSVRNQDGHDVVFVVQKGRAERRAVTVGSAQNNDVVLISGVSGGERVIVDSSPGLVDGTAVKEKKL